MALILLLPYSFRKTPSFPHPLRDKKSVMVFIAIMSPRRQPNHRKRLLVPSELVKPNPKCYVCSAKPEVHLRLNVNKMTVGAFEEKVLKARFGMVAPDAEIDDGKGTILISSEEGKCNASRQVYNLLFLLHARFSQSHGTVGFYLMNCRCSLVGKLKGFCYFWVI